MKVFVLAVCIGLVALTKASQKQNDGGVLLRAPRGVAGSDQDAAVVRLESEVKDDHFKYLYETANGISAEASGSLKKLPEGEALVISGQYQYTAPDGTPVQMSYEADESGYHPSGALIPTPHPIPAYIARSLEYIAAHPAPVDKRP